MRPPKHAYTQPADLLCPMSDCTAQGSPSSGHAKRTKQLTHHITFDQADIQQDPSLIHGNHYLHMAGNIVASDGA